MIAINRITVKYSADEDRLCFVTATSTEDSLILWMTARIAVRLVKALIDKLDATIPVAEGKPVSHTKQQALKQWEQSAANLTKKPAPEVKAQPETSQNLIRSVDIGQMAKGYGLVFRWAKDKGAQASLTPIELRQFLQIIYTTFKQAGWPMDVWPASYNQQKEDKKKPQQMCLH